MEQILIKAVSGYFGQTDQGVHNEDHHHQKWSVGPGGGGGGGVLYKFVDADYQVRAAWPHKDLSSLWVTKLQ